MSKTFIAAALIFAVQFAKANSDYFYSSTWCAQQNGQHQKKLPDGTKPDCTLEDSVVEVEILNKAGKVYESVGQALHYATVAKKKPQIVYVIENPQHSIYVERVRNIIQEFKLPIILTEYRNVPESKPKDSNSETILSDHVQETIPEIEPTITPETPTELQSPEPTADDALLSSAISPQKSSSDPTAEITPSRICTKHCSKGKACGDSCISKKYTCTQPPGSACDY